jgi:hypothetical protein
MTDISADERQKAKAAAANLAVAANDTASSSERWGPWSSSPVPPAVSVRSSASVGAGLAVGGFGAWLVGNRYQRLANDPPRPDFDQVTTSAARVVEESLPTEEPHATVVRLAAQEIVLVGALGALVTSLERFDGAKEAGDLEAASSQADAVRQNAQGSSKATNEPCASTTARGGPTLVGRNSTAARTTSNLRSVS